MSQVSRNLMRKEVGERLNGIFESSISYLKTADTVRDFISDLLTSTEKIMLAKRLGIAVLLDKGYDYRSVCRVLKVSSGTINSVIKQRSINGKGYGYVIDKILKDEKSEKSILEFEKFISKFLSPSSSHGRIESRYFSKELRLSKKDL